MISTPSIPTDFLAFNLHNAVLAGNDSHIGTGRKQVLFWSATF